MACSKEDNNRNDNLETFSIWWLDTEVHNQENREAQKQLRSIINDLKTWQYAKEFEQCIQKMSPDDRVVLILSGRMGREVVPRIHLLRQVSLIYVYCMDKKANEQWAQEYKKVKGVFVQLDELIGEIKLNHKCFIKNEEPLSINVFKVNDNVGKTLTGINGQFLNFQLLIDILLRMKPNKIYQKEFIKICNKEYKDNVEYSKVAKEFYTSYTPEKAVWWYTREDIFIYRILNRALRRENINLLASLHWFIKDICRQLSQYQCKQPIQVYRGQRMSNDELSSYQNSTGQFISINSFFSTTLNKQEAIRFTCEYVGNNSIKKSSNDGLKPVLFDISADPRAITTLNRPFANISSFSSIPKEQEILFMVGSIFRLDNINFNCSQDDGQILTVIQMTLCGDEQHDLHNLYNCMRKEYENGETDFRSLGTLLVKMGKFDLAEEYYHKMLDQLSPKDPALGDLYHLLGRVAVDKGNNDASFEWYQKSLAIKMQTRASDYVSICQTFNGIGIVLQKKGNFTQALEYYNKAVSWFQQAHDENHLYLGALYHNIGFIYKEQQNYSEALSFYKKSIAIKKKHLASGHPDFAASYNTMGIVHQCLNNHDIALDYYNTALEINRKALPSAHPDIAMNYKNIGVVYALKNEFKLALKYLKDAEKIYRQSPSWHSSDVSDIDKLIKYVSNQFKQI